MAEMCLGHYEMTQEEYLCLFYAELREIQAFLERERLPCRMNMSLLDD